jgi:3-deoxy-D-manno-octulosonic-acid transferase
MLFINILVLLKGFIKSITGSVIWVHCVSMGEFRAAIVLIDALIKGIKEIIIM